MDLAHLKIRLDPQGHGKFWDQFNLNNSHLYFHYLPMPRKLPNKDLFDPKRAVSYAN